MDGWMNKWIDVRVDGWLKKISVQNHINQVIWLDACSLFMVLDEWTDICMSERMTGWMGKWMDKCMSERMNEWMDGWFSKTALFIEQVKDGGNANQTVLHLHTTLSKVVKCASRHLRYLSHPCWCAGKNHFQPTGRLSSATMSQVCPFRLALSRPGNIYMSNAAPFRGNSLQKFHIFYIEYLVRQREHWWGLQSSLNAQLLSAQYYCICRILGVCSYPHPHLALLANRLLNRRKKERG